MFAKARTKLVEYAPVSLFVATLIIIAFLTGYVVHARELWPYQVISDASQTLKDVKESKKDVEITRTKSTDVTLENMVASRFRSPPDRGILWAGGRFRFRDLCSETDCLAVEYGPGGEIQHLYPLRIDEIIDAIQDAGGVVQTIPLIPWQKAGAKAQVFGISRYPNGDLLVVFHHISVYPNLGAAARIDMDGHLVWLRLANHHEPHLTPDGIAYIPSSTVMDEERRAIFDGTTTLDHAESQVKACGGRIGTRNDVIDMIGPDGTLLKRIDLTGEMMKYPYGAVVLFSTSNHCDPLHTNSVEVVGPDAAGTWGLASGDLVVSMRNVNAFAIMDGETHAIKRLVRGTFAQQHSVRHVSGSRFIMFDNRSGDALLREKGARLLEIDISDGKETSVFPNENTEEDLLQLHSAVTGSVKLSGDLTRALVTYSMSGTTVEVLLSDGQVLNVYRNLHNVSRMDWDWGGKFTHAGKMNMSRMNYVE